MLNKKYLRVLLSISALFSTAAIAGCSGEKKEGGDNESAEHAAKSSEAPAASAATGDTIIIEAWTDGTGNYFKPKKVEAHPGDVLRYVLKVGVHNVHFLPLPNVLLQNSILYYQSVFS